MIGVVLTLAIFLAGVIFHSGRLTSRVDALEEAMKTGRAEMREDLARIRSVVDNIDGALRHEFVYQEGANGRRRDDRTG